MLDIYMVRCRVMTMITIASEGLSLCSDMIYTGSGINVLNDSFVRMGYHPYKLEAEYLVVVR